MTIHRQEFTQGRCGRCQVRYVWLASSPRVLLRDARCPSCGSVLKRTVHYVSLPVCQIADPRDMLPKAITP